MIDTPQVARAFAPEAAVIRVTVAPSGSVRPGRTELCRAILRRKPQSER